MSENNFYFKILFSSFWISFPCFLLDDDDDFGSLLEPMKEKDRTSLKEKAEEEENTFKNNEMYVNKLNPMGQVLL